MQARAVMTADLGYPALNAVKGPVFPWGSAISDTWAFLSSLALIIQSDLFILQSFISASGAKQNEMN